MRHRADATTVLLSTMEEVAVLDSGHAHVLNMLRAATTSLRLELLVSGDRANSPNKGGTRVNFTAEIIVYGNNIDMASVSSILSGARMFLQEPEQLDPSATYRNPHVLSWDDQDDTPRFRRILPSVEAEFENVVEGILAECEVLPSYTEFSQDARIISALCRWAFSLLPRYWLIGPDQCLQSPNISLTFHVEP